MKDLYHDIKKVHLAQLISNTGGVSPLCAKKPRRLNLKKASWTLVKKLVTCKRCLALISTPGK